MNTPDSLRDTVLASVAGYLGSDAAKITPTSLLEEDLELDSTEMVDIYVDLEKKLSISMKDVKFADLKTVNDLIKAVALRMPAAVA